jgi:hypothetical protein
MSWMTPTAMYDRCVGAAQGSDAWVVRATAARQ